jgi:hypothetical protein
MLLKEQQLVFQPPIDAKQLKQLLVIKLNHLIWLDQGIFSPLLEEMEAFYEELVILKQVWILPNLRAFLEVELFAKL